VSADPFESRVPFVFDTSAWRRQSEPKVLGGWEAAIEAGLLVSCPVAALEILAATRDEREFELINGALAALPQAPVTASACQAAPSAASTRCTPTGISSCSLGCSASRACGSAEPRPGISSPGSNSGLVT